MAHHGGMAGNVEINASAFLQIEHYDRQNENVNNTGIYKLYNTYSASYDAGLWLNARTVIFGSHQLLFGADFKSGKLDATDIYRTSTDELTYGGKMLFGGLFIQDEFKMISGRVAVQLALRFDMARFHGGFLNVINPTAATGFIRTDMTEYSDNTWNELSPKINVTWLIGGQVNTYLSYSRGFMPPKLDDLCRSGKISKGFKLANPNLQPETVGTLEWGWNLYPVKGFSIQPSLYWSDGRDFQYFVSTGDSLETGDGQLRPVLQRRNVSQVTILGAELAVNYDIRENFRLFLNYAYNHCYINKFEGAGNQGDLSGNILIESPENLFSGGIIWNNRIIPFSVSGSYTGSQWYDDENTTLIEGYFLLDDKFYKDFLEHYSVSVSLENLLDNRYIDRKGLEAPGRFIMVELSAKI